MSETDIKKFGSFCEAQGGRYIGTLGGNYCEFSKHNIGNNFIQIGEPELNEKTGMWYMQVDITEPDTKEPKPEMLSEYQVKRGIHIEFGGNRMDFSIL